MDKISESRMDVSNPVLLKKSSIGGLSKLQSGKEYLSELMGSD